MDEDDQILSEIEDEGLPETSLFDEVSIPDGPIAPGLDLDPDEA